MKYSKEFLSCYEGGYLINRISIFVSIIEKYEEKYNKDLENFNNSEIKEIVDDFKPIIAGDKVMNKMDFVYYIQYYLKVVEVCKSENK